MRYSYDIIIKPVITEVSMEQAQNGKYTFKVAKDASKTQIKLAVEEIFDVDVKKVNVLNQLGKMKRRGRDIGRRPSYKKAIITLREKSKPIEFFHGL